jgi:UDP:flavonoid glycosyltransferase YjiC (YdhE family)
LKAVLATFGTHGDLHPFIALGLGLREHGFDPVVATSSDFQDNVESAGLRFHAVRPTQSQIESDLGMSRSQMLRLAQKRPQIVWTKATLPYLQPNYEDSLRAMQGASLVMTSTLGLGAKLAAEKLQLPHIGVVLQPSLLMSAYDPPLFGHALAFSRLINQSGRLAIRAWLGMARKISRTWARPIDRFRHEIGLPGSRSHPFFEGQYFNGPAVGLYSRQLGDVQPDFPPGFVIAGFAFYDGTSGALTPDLDDFIAVGPPPLVFTQGTSAVLDSTRFTQVAIDAVEHLKQRAVFVLDEQQCTAFQHRASPKVRITSYLPYSSVFSRCNVIVHHGGIGTTAQALRSGRPQLITPYFGDQPDNAARVARLGVARVLDPKRWSTSVVASELRQLLSDPDMARQAAVVSQSLQHEHGVKTVVQLALDAVGHR